MNDIAFPVGDDGFEIHVFHTVKNVLIYIRVFPAQLSNELFHFLTLGTAVSGSAVFSEAAGALQKFEAVVTLPCYNICFPHKVKRADQFHSGVMEAVQFWHHGADFGTVKHAHEDGFDHIVEVMAKCNLVAAKFLSMLVKTAAAHLCTQVAWGAAGLLCNFENTCVKDVDGKTESGGIVDYFLPVFSIVAGVHHKIFYLERKVAVFLKMLHTFCKQHRILAAGNTHQCGRLAELTDIS